ncbi:hypothetical protein Nit79A3_1868 [Nitrosomonas sp. Is79A3]|uniref:small metal-binding protein SmbP n=1 Tax=Nitrosomonas sp. (strain Is79A3) TaxID=261292 RepID=UPI000215CB90
MNNISTILAAGILVIFFSSQVSAAGYGGQAQSEGKATSSIDEAIKHAEMAKAHGDDAKEILKHAEISLKYAKDTVVEVIEKINISGMERIDASIKHLEEAIKHAKLGHADVASKHIDAALNEMHAYSAKRADYLSDN